MTRKDIGAHRSETNHEPTDWNLLQYQHVKAKEMTGRNDKAKRWRLWRFSLRELVGATLIIALLIGFLREVAIRQEAERRLDGMVSPPQLVIHNPKSLERYSINSGLSVVGRLYRPDSLKCSKAIVEILSGKDLRRLAMLKVRPTLLDNGEYDVASHFDSPIGLSPGTYAIRVRCFDGESLITTATEVFQTFDEFATEP